MKSGHDVQQKPIDSVFRLWNETDPYFVSDPSLEVAGEGCWLDPLQFSVLDRFSTQVVIQVHSKDGCSSTLILAALLSFEEQAQALINLKWHLKIVDVPMSAASIPAGMFMKSICPFNACMCA